MLSFDKLARHEAENIEGGREICGACERLPLRYCHYWRPLILRLRLRSRAASYGSIIGTVRPAPPSTKRRPTRSTFPSCRSSTISSFTSRTWRKTAWSGDGKTLNFKLRQGVKWHDGKPFTSNDVKCTFDMLMGKSQQKFRKNPRKSWYDEVVDVTPNGDFEVAFNLKRPQPALLALLASGYTPVY